MEPSLLSRLERLVQKRWSRNLKMMIMRRPVTETKKPSMSQTTPQVHQLPLLCSVRVQSPTLTVNSPLCKSSRETSRTNPTLVLCRKRRKTSQPSIRKLPTPLTILRTLLNSSNSAGSEDLPLVHPLTQVIKMATITRCRASTPTRVTTSLLPQKASRWNTTQSCLN